MTHTFDIRFARSAGLAAFLEAPENRFHWKGGGLLRIDAQSISFTAKRSLLALFAGNRTQRIPAENLREVYREGAALRVEFDTKDSARVVLPFWAGDRDIAARIVRLLPTKQTVEIEHDTGTQSGKPRADKRALLIIGVLLGAVTAGIWALYPRAAILAPALATSAVEPSTPIESPQATASNGASVSAIETRAPHAAPTTSTPSRFQAARRVEQPAFPIDMARLAVETQRSRDATRQMADSSATMSYDANGVPVASGKRAPSDGVVPIVPSAPEYEAARRQLDLFIAESTMLRADYHDARYDGIMQRLGEIDRRWWKVTERINNSWDFDDPALESLQEIELAVSRAWRRAYSMGSNPALLVAADEEVKFAEMLQERASRFVD